MKLLSFGFAHTKPPDGYILIDARYLPNPHSLPELRDLDGRDQRVQDWLCEVTPLTGILLEELEVVTTDLAVGCHSGRHRSVAIVEMLVNYHLNRNHSVEVTHMGLGLHAQLPNTKART